MLHNVFAQVEQMLHLKTPTFRHFPAKSQRKDVFYIGRNTDRLQRLAPALPLGHSHHFYDKASYDLVSPIVA